MAKQKSSDSNPGKQQASGPGLPDIESPLHKVLGLLKVLMAFASGDYQDIEDSRHQGGAIFGTLGLVAKLLLEIQAAARNRSDLPAQWGADLASAIAVTTAIRGQYLRADESVSGYFEGGAGTLDVFNAVWALADQVEHIHTSALYPSALPPQPNDPNPAHQRH